mmetsp:Transcript_17500/g.41029  ORF Transcript_17500/g.41029 Transcript_17500/m.41029 type:complete len:126 (+) Transcript_17500:46-423(+)
MQPRNRTGTRAQGPVGVSSHDECSTACSSTAVEQSETQLFQNMRTSSRETVAEDLACFLAEPGAMPRHDVGGGLQVLARSHRPSLGVSRLRTEVRSPVMVAHRKRGGVAVRENILIQCVAIVTSL